MSREKIQEIERQMFELGKELHTLLRSVDSFEVPNYEFETEFRIYHPARSVRTARQTTAHPQHGTRLQILYVVGRRIQRIRSTISSRRCP